jgi:hypothetical protein
VELASAEAAVLAAVAREPARLPLHEVAHELDVVAPLRRRAQELRLEQLVQPEQRGIAAQLVPDDPVGGLRSLGVERRLEGDVQEIERGVLREVAVEEREPGRRLADRLVALQEPVGDEREEGRVLGLDALPVLDRRRECSRGRTCGSP